MVEITGQNALIFLLIVFTTFIESFPVKDVLAHKNVSYHWRRRTMACKKIIGADENDAAKCALQSSDQQISEFGTGCYNEFVPKMMNIRTLCPLNCKNSDESTILNKRPSNNHKCSQFFNYGIIRLNEDTYFWRSGQCLNETISFEIRCGFPFPQKEFVDFQRQQFFSLI
uniref:ShKT domain-containing protein n=1 Tax=Panagrolaimus sp. PS1159 TaxID=55785 RepID=A0AC35GRB8_9BILA